MQGSLLHACMRAPPLLLALAALLAGCSGPSAPGDVGSADATPPITNRPTPEGLPDAPTPAPPTAVPTSANPTGASPSDSAGTPPTGATPTTPAPSGPPYTGFWTHDHGGPAKSLTLNVAPGSGLTDFLVGFHPAFDAMRFRCDGANATIRILDPEGDLLAQVRAGDRPLEGAGCPSALRVPAVHFAPGAWTFSFSGEGDIVGYIAAGERAGATNVSFNHFMPHDFGREENTTIFTVPAYAKAVDVTMRLEPRLAGSPCPADSIRLIVRDPRQTIFARLDMPAEPLPTECEKTAIFRDVILTPGQWSVQWGGSGSIVGSILIEPHRAA